MSAHSLGALKATMLSVHPGIIVPSDDGVELRLTPCTNKSRRCVPAYPILDSRDWLLRLRPNSA
jgi:hypothetical protein